MDPEMKHLTSHCCLRVQAVTLLYQMSLMLILMNTVWLDSLLSGAEENINSKKRKSVISVLLTFHFIEKNLFHLSQRFILHFMFLFNCLGIREEKKRICESNVAPKQVVQD